MYPSRLATLRQAGAADGAANPPTSLQLVGWQFALALIVPVMRAIKHMRPALLSAERGRFPAWGEWEGKGKREIDTRRAPRF